MKIFNLGKNQIVVSIEGTLTFMSYGSKIAEYKRGSEELYLCGNMWDYSNTTRKYFKKFLEDFTNIEYNTKQKFIKQINENEKIYSL